MTPWPPSPPTRISVRAIGAPVGTIAIAQDASEVLVHRVEPRRTLAVDELAHRDLSLELEAHRLRGGTVPHDAPVLVVLQLIDAVAEPVAPRVQRGARREHLDEG